VASAEVEVSGKFRKDKVMAEWAEVSRELEDTLRLKTKPVAYKKLKRRGS
jgi:hypothetical protein